MANCNNHFKTFTDEIRLTDARRESLKKSRKELRNKIRNYFSDNLKNEEQPKFTGQGSLSVDTIINPIPRKITVDGKEKVKLYYDVDDGIYFEGSKNIEDRSSVKDYHKWVYDAVNGHTDTPAIDKNTCVRTVFSDGHNIDNPIYYKQGEKPELAHKKSGWIESDPKAFGDWFLNQIDKTEQLRKIVRFLKAWCDKREFENDSKAMPTGMIMTILAANNISYSTDRDDIALKETLVNIEDCLKRSFVCERPTVPIGENLLANYSNKDYFMNCLSKFIVDAKEALSEKNEKTATELWRKHLSNRFPLGENIVQENASNAGLRSLIPASNKPFCN